MLPSGRLFFALLVSAWSCLGQAVSNVQSAAPLLAPLYESGYILDWNTPSNDALTVYGPDTKFQFTSSNRVVPAGFYFGWTLDSNGTSARAFIDKEYQGHIELLDTTGKRLRQINTGSYQPSHLTFGPDHTLWTVGFADLCDPKTDFNVVRHYSLVGEKLGESIPWSQIAGANNSCTALQLIIGGRFLFSSTDRLGFLTLADFGNSKWIEVAFDGSLLGQYHLGPYGSLCFFPSAMTPSGNVYARISKDREFDGYAILDRSAGTWRPVSGYPTGRLIGSDGDDLVFFQGKGVGATLQKIPQTAIQIKTQQTADARQ